MLSQEQGIIYQIFIPKNKLDSVAYFARNYGHPYGNSVVLNYLFNRDVSKEERSLAFWSLLKANPRLALKSEPKETVVSEVLDKFRANPWAFPNSIRWQIRLLLTKDIILSPDSGVIIKTYTTDSKQVENDYDNERKMIVDEFVEDMKPQALQIPMVTEIGSLDEIIDRSKNKKLTLNKNTLFVTELEGVLIDYLPEIKAEIDKLQKYIFDFTKLDESKNIAHLKYMDKLKKEYKLYYMDDYIQDNKVVRTKYIDDSPNLIKTIDKTGATILAISANDLVFENLEDDLDLHGFSFNFQKKIVEKVLSSSKANDSVIFFLPNLSNTQMDVEDQHSLVSFGYENSVLYTGFRPYVDVVLKELFRELGYLKTTDKNYSPADKFKFENLVYLGKTGTDFSSIFKNFGQHFLKVDFLKYVPAKN